MAGSSVQYEEGMAEVGKVFQDSGPGRGRILGLQNVLQGGPKGKPIIWVRDLDFDPQDKADPQRLPP